MIKFILAIMFLFYSLHTVAHDTLPIKISIISNGYIDKCEIATHGMNEVNSEDIKRTFTDRFHFSASGVKSTFCTLEPEERFSFCALSGFSSGGNLVSCRAKRQGVYWYQLTNEQEYRAKSQSKCDFYCFK